MKIILTAITLLFCLWANPALSQAENKSGNMRCEMLLGIRFLNIDSESLRLVRLTEEDILVFIGISDAIARYNPAYKGGQEMIKSVLRSNLRIRLTPEDLLWLRNSADSLSTKERDTWARRILILVEPSSRDYVRIQSFIDETFEHDPNAWEKQSPNVKAISVVDDISSGTRHIRRHPTLEGYDKR